MIRRISTKWVLAVLAAVVVPFVGFAWFVNVKVSDRMAGDVVRYHLLSMAADLAERIDEEIEERRIDSAIIARVHFVSWIVEDVLSGSEISAFETVVRSHFDDHVTLRGAYDHVIAMTVEGHVVMTNSVYPDGTPVPDELTEKPGNLWESRGMRTEPWFRRVLEEGEAALDFHRIEFSGLDLDGSAASPGGYYVGFARRIDKTNAPGAAGVLLTLMSWDAIQSMVDSYGVRHLEGDRRATVGTDIYESSYAWLWGQDASTIIAHPDRGLYGREVTEIYGGRLKPMARAARSARWGMYPDYEFRGADKKAAFAHCKPPGEGGFGWVVGVGVDDEDIYAPVQELSNWLFTTSAVILGLAVLFTFWIAHRTTRPIRDLEQHTRRVGQGDLEARIDVRSRDELGQLAASFNRMTAELKDLQEQLVKAEKEAAWREMARQVAHEIKNPLTPISLSAGLLERSWHEKSPDFEAILGRTISMIQRQVDNMREVARDFYAFAGEHKDPRPVPLGLLLEHVLDLNAAWAEERGVSLRLEEVGDVHVRADPDELQRALLNLVTNAVDAMPDGGELRVTVRETEDEVVIELRDTGTGIDSEVADMLFQPYFTTRSSGTGLGLAIVRRVVEDLGGRVELFDAPDGPGAVARVTLPRGEG